MKLAILSDTHGLLRPEVLEYLKDVDAILHGGDINKPGIIDERSQQTFPVWMPWCSATPTSIFKRRKTVFYGSIPAPAVPGGFIRRSP